MGFERLVRPQRANLEGDYRGYRGLLLDVVERPHGGQNVSPRHGEYLWIVHCIGNELTSDCTPVDARPVPLDCREVRSLHRYGVLLFGWIYLSVLCYGVSEIRRRADLDAFRQ